MRGYRALPQLREALQQGRTKETKVAAVPVSKKSVWGGRIISALAVLFLLFDGVIHVLKPARVVEAFGQLGYPASLALGIGLVELGCVVLYVIPRTAILGAILLTGYLGGATASRVRVGHALFSETLFPVYVGVLVWGGLFLRDDQIRTLFPLRREAAASARTTKWRRRDEIHAASVR